MNFLQFRKPRTLYTCSTTTVLERVTCKLPRAITTVLVYQMVYVFKLQHRFNYYWVAKFHINELLKPSHRAKCLSGLPLHARRAACNSRQEAQKLWELYKTLQYLTKRLDLPYC